MTSPEDLIPSSSPSQSMDNSQLPSQVLTQSPNLNWLGRYGRMRKGYLSFDGGHFRRPPGVQEIVGPGAAIFFPWATGMFNAGAINNPHLMQKSEVSTKKE